ncbi:MAG: SRPBCC family protein [Ilumatobacteraceae bacterium]
MSADVVVSRTIAASPEVIWALLADLPRMPEWSPESERVEWLGGATHAAPGAKFRGTNSNGKKSWKTVGEVSTCDTARQLTFEVRAGPFRVAQWSYVIEPGPTGCQVTESWLDRRNQLLKKVSARVSGVNDRAGHNRQGMEDTLGRLALEAERNDST